MIEMAVVLSISAMILGGGLAMSKPVIEKVQKNKTDRQMEDINDRLASFVHRNNRLPCPADPNATSDPFGAEWNSGGSGAGTCIGARSIGIVPFRALGLKEDDVRDAWGNFLTYHVSPVFAANPDNIDDNDHDRVHELCRSTAWIYNPDGGEWDYDFNFKKEDFVGESGEQIFMDEYVFTVEDSGDVAVTFNTMEVRTDGSIREHLTTPFSWYDHAWHSDYYGDPTSGYTDVAGVGSQRRHGKFYWLTQAEFAFADNPTLFEVTIAEIKGNIESNGTVGIDVRLYVDEDIDGDGDIDNDDFIIDEVPLTEDDLNTAGQAVIRYDSNDPNSLAYGRSIRKTRIYSLYGGPIDNGNLPPASMTFVGVRTSVSGNVGNPQNINPAKARFCCPMVHHATYDQTKDIVIVDENNIPVVSSSRSTDSGKYDDKDEIVSGSVESDIFVPAYVLISHGTNGHGAQLRGNALSTGGGSLIFVNNINRISVSDTVGNGFGSDEVLNSDGDNSYVYRLPDHTDDVSYFDDIVMWRTQDQIYSEFGNQSCQTP